MGVGTTTAALDGCSPARPEIPGPLTLPVFWGAYVGFFNRGDIPSLGFSTSLGAANPLPDSPVRPPFQSRVPLAVVMRCEHSSPSSKSGLGGDAGWLDPSPQFST
ncbi:unnamed protein product [Arctia plantaginis]|uniref:Uncharacterized protein n=1 Tax=Arctia plantaginis TaxID=874455 RepID=A0A8S1BP04_ARCPL|nr:unnamed protein product [Arctia plantaginis]